MVVKDSARTHVVIPRELLEAIDELVGPRKRREFIVAALRRKVQQERQHRAIQNGVGFIDPKNHPEWANGSSEWVHNMRQEDQRYVDERRAGWIDR